MRDTELKCATAGRSGAMLSSVCGRIQLFIVLIVGGVSIATGETARPPNASVYIISPKDGDTVASPFRVQFGLSGMGVAPAGVDTPNTGHHHLLIDVDESLDPNEPIPQDKKHLHFGAGQTEALIELSPGKRRLQLVFGDSSHHLFHPPLVSDVITVNVN
jgi:Domain of unknown function (DUF4399)